MKICFGYFRSIGAKGDATANNKNIVFFFAGGFVSLVVFVIDVFLPMSPTVFQVIGSADICYGIYARDLLIFA